MGYLDSRSWNRKPRGVTSHCQAKEEVSEPWIISMPAEISDGAYMQEVDDIASSPKSHQPLAGNFWQAGLTQVNLTMALLGFFGQYYEQFPKN